MLRGFVFSLLFIFCDQRLACTFFLIKDGLTFLNEQKSNKKLIGGIVDVVLVKGNRLCVALNY